MSEKSGTAMEKLTRCSYAVVNFPDGNGCLSVVPISWLATTPSSPTVPTLCKWPPAHLNFKKASRRLTSPTDDWESYKAVPVHYSRTYASANEYLDKNKYSSEVEVFSSDGDSSSKKRPLRKQLAPEIPAGPSTKDFNRLEENGTRFSKKRPLQKQLAPEIEMPAGPSTKDFNRLEAKVDILIKNIAELKEELVESKETIRNLKRNEHHNFMDTNEKFKILENFEEIKDFEEKLNDEDEFAKAVKQCGYIGGKDMKDAVRRILSCIFSHQLALNLSWNEANGKTSVQNYPNLLLLINVSLHCNQDYKNVPRVEVEDVIKRWLRYAADRNGGRYKRMKKAINNVAPDV